MKYFFYMRSRRCTHILFSTLPLATKANLFLQVHAIEHLVFGDTTHWESYFRPFEQRKTRQRQYWSAVSEEKIQMSQEEAKSPTRTGQKFCTLRGAHHSVVAWKPALIFEEMISSFVVSGH